MARRFEVQFECACGMRNPAEIGKTDYFKPVVVKFACPDCKSEMIMIIKKAAIHGTAVNITRKMTKISDDLRLMNMEEAQQERENA